jgi:hypothetical protein
MHRPLFLGTTAILLATSAGCGTVRTAHRYPFTAAALDTQPDLCSSSLELAAVPSTIDMLAAVAPGSKVGASTAASNAALLQVVRRGSKTAHVQRAGSPPPVAASAAQSVVTSRFGAPAASNEAWVLAGAAPSPSADELARRVREAGNAYARVTLASQQCFMQVMAGNLGAMSQTLHEKYDEYLIDPDVARAHSRKAITALRNSDLQQAALVAVLASYEGALGGQVDASDVDRTIASIRDSLAHPVLSSDADVAAMWALAKDKADAYDAESKTWGMPEYMRLEGLGLQRLAYREHERAMGNSLSGPPAAASDPGSSGAAEAQGKGAGVVKALKALLNGNMAGVIAGAAQLLPDDNPLCVSIRGASDLASGDYIGAMKEASLLAPKDSSLATVLALPDTARSVARSYGAR